MRFDVTQLVLCIIQCNQQIAFADLLAFADGKNVDTGEAMTVADYQRILDDLPALWEIFPDADSTSPGVRASIVEFVLEGLHLNKLLNKDSVDGQSTYSG